MIAMNFLIQTAVVLYFLSFLSAVSYKRIDVGAFRKRLGLFTIGALFLAWTVQGIELGLFLKHGNLLARTPNAFELVAWVIAFSFLLFSMSVRFFRLSNLFIGLILLFFIFSYLYGDHFPLAIGTSRRGELWGKFHLFSFAMGFAVLTVNFLIGGLYLFKEWGLKHKRWALIEAIPPLDRLYWFFSVLLGTGFLFFTAGLLSGGGWSKILHGVYLSNDPKELITLATWILYAVLINIHRLPYWHGRRSIALSAMAFLTLLASILGVSHHV